MPDYAAGHGVGLAVVTTAIVVMMVADWRLGCFLLGFVLYFGGFPAIQFDHRHFFHLEFILWWAALFMVQAAVSDARQTLAQARPLLFRKVTAGLATLALCVAVLAMALWAARRYQQGTVRAYLDAYVAAPREMIPLAQLKSDQQAVRVSPHARSGDRRFHRRRCKSVAMRSGFTRWRSAMPIRRGVRIPGFSRSAATTGRGSLRFSCRSTRASGVSISSMHRTGAWTALDGCAMAGLFH